MRTQRAAGVVSTVLCLDDNTRVEEAVKEPGHGRVLVVHCGGSLQRAVVGAQIAAAAVENGWKGFVVNGCIRDSVELAGMQIGVKALGAHPRKTELRGDGKRDVAVTFGGVTFLPGEILVADEDGVVVGPAALLPPLKIKL
jgi:regulator of ribonuclease activity A